MFILFHQLAGLEPNSKSRRLLLALFPVFGTWSWCNLGFGGSWQIALGFALLGQVAALYFTLIRRKPFLAGACFALAFGNRTELILTLPIYLYFWSPWPGARLPFGNEASKESPRDWWKPLAWFLAIPVALGLCTAAYNLARFDSIFDFGYARITNLAQEPWYQGGLFSFHAIPWNAYKMLFEGMQDIATFPYLRPLPVWLLHLSEQPIPLSTFSGRRTPQSSSLDRDWAFDPGTLVPRQSRGWQFSYRYAMILLPWMFLLLVSNGPRKLSATELGLFLVSVAINAMAVYHFLWTTICTRNGFAAPRLRFDTNHRPGTTSGPNAVASFALDNVAEKLPGRGSDLRSRQRRQSLIIRCRAGAVSCDHPHRSRREAGAR